MLPPPMTRPTAAPSFTTPTTSSQRRFIVSKSNPNPLSPASASPESFMRTRGYLSVIATTLVGLSACRRADKPPSVVLSRFTHLEPRDATDLHVLSRLTGYLLHEIAHRPLGIAHPGLMHQADVLVVRLDFSCDDLVDDVLRLPALAHLFDEDP